MEHIHEARWLWLVPVLPLIGAFINGAFGLKIHRRYGEKPIHIIAVLMPSLSFIITAFYFLQLLPLPAEERQMLCQLYDWIKIGDFSVPLAFWLDQLSAAMTLMVTFVGTLIHIYSIGYMHKDPSYWRFFAFMNLFMFSMLTLILGDNFLLMFVGWEGVGLCSYLLISFWYHDVEKAKAGMKAFITNRIGDFGFIIGMFALIWSLGGGWSDSGYSFQFPDRLTFVFREIQELAPFLVDQKIFGVGVITFVCLFFFWGATAKSAQIPLYVWLPDAMAGPTPVSALIHAATMVTAGVYMVARLNFLFALSPVAMTVVATVGVVTALFAATIALFQYDIKKVLAYSTVSQLGFMFLGVGVGAYGVGIFHLLTHAFFKACLFLGSGSVIHAMHHVYHKLNDHHRDPQDMRNMGGLAKHLPATRWTYLAACFAISGFPLMSGFFSKDEILWMAFANANTLIPGQVLWTIGAITAILTAFYMFRSYFMTFTGTFRSGSDAEKHLHESPATMTTVLKILGVLSIIGGVIGLPHLWHLPNLLEGWLEPLFESAHHHVHWHHYAVSIEWLLMLTSIVIALAGISLAYKLYNDNKSTVPARFLKTFPTYHRIAFNKYYVDELYQKTVINGTLAFSKVSGWFDSHIIDGLVNLMGYIARFFSWLHGLCDTYIVDGAVNGLAAINSFFGRKLRRVQTGRINSYLYGLMGGGLLLILVRYLLG
ncbi:MAG: NADH-quinone oxidoreductase subunit L [Candidatus Zhuqueibacterota bacterium]